LIPSDYFSELSNSGLEEVNEFGGVTPTVPVFTQTNDEEPNFDEEPIEERKDIVLPPKPKITSDLKDAVKINNKP
jgi:hypothetical protein